MLRSRELVPLVSAPIRSRLDKRFLGIDVGYLNFAPRCKKSAARRMRKACYRGGPKLRNSGRPELKEAKTVGGPPPGGNFKMSPG
jgi:hypothetical protein